MTRSFPSKRRLLLAASAALLLGIFVFVMLRVGPLAPIQVTTAQVKEGSVKPALFGIGSVEARRSWMVGPTVAGRVLSVKVDVGDSVKAGQLMAEMDPVDLDQRLAALDAALERAKSAQAAAASVQADATARRELAVSTLRRSQDLADQHFISSGALENFNQARASAEAVLDTARANAAGAAQEVSRAKADRAALAQQRSSLRLLAPSAGVVSARDAEPGSTVVAGQPVLRVVDPASLWVRLRLDQGRSAGIAPGLPAYVVLRSQALIKHAARVARVELLADNVTEERIAQLAFDRLPLGVSVGELVEATIDLPPMPSSLLLAAASLQRQAGVTGVWRLESGKPVFVPVTVGASSLDGQVQIRTGLARGDEIVVYSQKPVTAGARLQVVEFLVQPAAAAGAAP